MTWLAVKTFLGWILGGAVDLFHKLLPPERLKALAIYALVAVVGWLGCFVHYDVRGLKNDRAAFGLLKVAHKALEDSVAEGARLAQRQQAATREAAYQAGYDAGLSFQRTAGILKPIFLEVPYAVSREADSACAVPWGFVRLWDAFATGSDLDSVRARLAPGQPDDARSDVTLSEIVALFGTASERFHLNADQLNRLIQFETDAAAIAKPPPQ